MTRAKIVALMTAAFAVQAAVLGAQFYVGGKERTSYVAYYPTMQGTKEQNDWMTSRNDVRMVRTPTTLPGMREVSGYGMLDVHVCEGRGVAVCKTVKRVYSDGTEERYP